MTYIENPKTKGSGILCAIPQTGTCPMGCADCFFQSGRSYLEPLAENLPNLPVNDDFARDYAVIRVNDGNDSSVEREEVISATAQYRRRFFNTSIPYRLEEFPAPVVLTVNPQADTDVCAALLDEIPSNLMFVRVRTDLWNLEVVDAAVAHYTSRDVPVVLTFMAFWGTADTIPEQHQSGYIFRKRTLNSYWAITNAAWHSVMDRYADNALVYSCGREGVAGASACKRCGNCLREYYSTITRLEGR